MALTQKGITKLNKTGRHHDGRGLYVQVAESTTNDEVRRSYLFRYELDGRERMMGLGSTEVFSLEEARDAAHEARRLVRRGIDPIEARKAERTARELEAAKTLTFKAAVRGYYDANSKKWKNAKHSAQFLSTLEAYAFKHIGSLPVSVIDTGLVLKVLEADSLWHTKTETASRVRGRIEAVLDWSTVRGYRTGDNPARWRGHLDQVLPARGQIAKVEHHPALPWKEAPEFFAALVLRPGIAARALEFTILTAARTGETIGARWSEIDLTAQLWTVPADRMKAKKEHRVALSDRAVEILTALPREGDFVFVGGKKDAAISNMAMGAVLKRMGRADLTVHGFRSCFRDWASESTAYPGEVLEMALAHVVANKVEAAYRRGDLFEKRRELVADWATYLATLPGATG